MPGPRIALSALAAVAFTAAVALSNPVPPGPPAVPNPLPAPAPLAGAVDPCPPAEVVDCPPGSPLPYRPLACAPRARVIVVRMPPPEIVYRSGCEKPGCQPPPGSSPGSSPPAANPPPPGAGAGTTTTANGTATVYHTYTVPYLTYNWVPVQQQTAFAGAALPVAPAGFSGVPVGAGAPAAGIFGGPIPTELELQFGRLLLSRLLGTGGQIGGPIQLQPTPAPCPEACEVKLRALQTQIADLDRKIESLRADTRSATLLNTQAIVDLQKEMDQLCAAILNLKRTDSKEQIVDDLQSAVKKLQERRK